METAGFARAIPTLFRFRLMLAFSFAMRDRHVKRKLRTAKAFPPMTVSAPSLIVDGSDESFRSLVDNLILFASQIQDVRQVLSSAMGVTQPQYNILMIVAHDRASHGMTIKKLAQQLNVTPSFAVTETNKLMASGLLHKQISATDRRRINLQLTEDAFQLIASISPLQRLVNDELFGDLTKTDFKMLSGIIKALIGRYEPTINKAKKFSGTLRST